MAALVRVSGPPNSHFVIGYPGISATLVSFLPPCPLIGLEEMRPSLRPLCQRFLSS